MIQKIMEKRKRNRKLLGDKIRYERERSGWSRKDLAHKSRLSDNHIAQFENGTRLPSCWNLMKLVKAFGHWKWLE